MTAAAIWEYPTAIAAVIIAVGVIGKAARWVYLWAKRLESSMTYVETEMRFNGGSTMRDGVRRIETKLDQHLIDHARSTDAQGGTPS